jgi:hypothetical protein
MDHHSRFQPERPLDDMNMRQYNGWIILGTLVFYLASIPVPALFPATVLLAWLVPVLNWPDLGSSARKQALFLALTGIAGLIFGAWNGVVLPWRDMLAMNIPLLAMFVAVSFLALATPDAEGADLPRGRWAALTTGAGIHLLGAVINISALFIFGDRMSRNRPLSREQASLLARSFTAAAWWSPFFMATGVAFTYAPDMVWARTLVPGIVMSSLAIVISALETGVFSRKRFEGYPMGVESLTMPLFLAVMVLAVHYWQPQLKVLAIICLLAPLGTLLFMRSRPRRPALVKFVNTSISSVSSAFALFLTAGIFSSGIKAVIRSCPDIFTLGSASLTPSLFTLLLGGMVAVGIAGVHPVVSVSVLSPLLLPMYPDHSQLAFLYLSSWGISTGCGPLSGVGLTLVGRFHIPPRAIIAGNLFYALGMWLIASLMNLVFFPQ